MSVKSERDGLEPARPWRIEMLGGLRALQPDGTVTRFRAQKTAAVLAYLAYHLQREHPREELLEVFWPGEELEVARHKLSVTLSTLRQKLEPTGTPDGAVLTAERFSVGLNPLAVATDVADLEAAVRAAAGDVRAAERVRCLAAAVALYRGPLLPGYYEEWILPEASRLDRLYLQALAQLAEHYEAGGELNRALDHAYLAVNVDPLREETHRELMRLLAATGQYSLALRQYRDLERLLRQELATSPSAATRDLAERINTGRLGVGVREETSTPAPPYTHLPVDPLRGCPRVPTTHPSTRRPTSWVPPGTRHTPTHSELEPIGGAVPLDSPVYVLRSTDQQFQAAITRGDSVVLLKGSAQVGKTSLLARGLEQARRAGARVVLTDLQALNAAQLASPDALLLALADTLADQLELDVSPSAAWHALGGPNLSFRRFLRRDVLERIAGPVVWGLDDADRLFACDFYGEVFALFRSWHNQRALDPAGPWARFTLAIAYATEAHLFITDQNRSPFNVGTRLELADFTLEQVATLNEQYAAGTPPPLRDAVDVERFHRLLGGHPYLVRRAFHELAGQGLDVAGFAERAGDDGWIYGDHLRLFASVVAADAELSGAAREVLEGLPCPDSRSFYRLRSAGIIAGDSPATARPRCALYADYLAPRLA